MARVSTYLNFDGNAEQAFDTYKKVFGTEYLSPINRFKDVPQDPNAKPISDAERELVMHVELPILAGHVIMATDVIESMGQTLKVGNNTTINLEPDTVEEAQRIFDGLSEGATDVMPLTKMFWGATWGTLLDRFGVRWMFNVAP